MIGEDPEKSCIQKLVGGGFTYFLLLSRNFGEDDSHFD